MFSYLSTYQKTQVVRTSLRLQRLKEAGEPISRSPSKEDNKNISLNFNILSSCGCILQSETPTVVGDFP